MGEYVVCVCGVLLVLLVLVYCSVYVQLEERKLTSGYSSFTFIPLLERERNEPALTGPVLSP